MGPVQSGLNWTKPDMSLDSVLSPLQTNSNYLGKINLLNFDIKTTVYMDKYMIPEVRTLKRLGEIVKSLLN